MKQEPDMLLPGEVLLKDVEEIGHIQGVPIKDVALNCGEHVGDGADAHTLNIGGVVSRSTSVIVSCLLDAVIDYQR